MMIDPLEQIFSQGYFLAQVVLPGSIYENVKRRDWKTVDELIHREVQKDGVLFKELTKYSTFSEIEFIISIRSSLVEPDEDGIWHDDGSRVLAFSLSLTLDHRSIEGGKLGLRKRVRDSDQFVEIETPPFGTMIVFATGYSGFEHKIHRVTQGERIIIAGWCT
jgi:hypothetical protein